MDINTYNNIINDEDYSNVFILYSKLSKMINEYEKNKLEEINHKIINKYTPEKLLSEGGIILFNTEDTRVILYNNIVYKFKLKMIFDECLHEYIIYNFISSNLSNSSMFNKILGYYSYDNYTCVISKNVEGISLNNWIFNNFNNKKLEDEKLRIIIKKVILQIYEAYKTIYFSHHDLHLSNIIIDNNNNPYIIDYGRSCCLISEKYQYSNPLVIGNVDAFFNCWENDIFNFLIHIYELLDINTYVNNRLCNLQFYFKESNILSDEEVQKIYKVYEKRLKLDNTLRGKNNYQREIIYENKCIKDFSKRTNLNNSTTKTMVRNMLSFFINKNEIETYFVNRDFNGIIDKTIIDKKLSFDDFTIKFYKYFY